MSRVCGFCGGHLVWHSGEEVAARDHGGNAVEKDTFRCTGCPRLYRHVVRERFTGDIHWWGVKQDAAQESWDDLPEASWPRFA